MVGVPPRNRTDPGSLRPFCGPMPYVVVPRRHTYAHKTMPNFDEAPTQPPVGPWSPEHFEF